MNPDTKHTATRNLGANELARWLTRDESLLSHAEKIKVRYELDGFMQAQGIEGRRR